MQIIIFNTAMDQQMTMEEEVKHNQGKINVLLTGRLDLGEPLRSHFYVEIKERPLHLL